tara:strand:- start:1353 stop:2501 length:1149 start_codon:yes stop_codon:yes gene_type:complete
MNAKSVKTRRGNRVFKKTEKSKNWVFLRTVGGRRYYFPLGPVLSEAKTLADQIDAHSLVNPIGETFRKFRPNGRKLESGSHVPTCEELVERYQLLAPTDLGVKASTADNYSLCFRVLVKTGLGREPRAVRLDELTPGAIRNFKDFYLSGLEDEGKIQSRKRTINSYLRSAQSLFSSDALKLYSDWDVSGHSPLTEAKGFRRCRKVYRLPCRELLASTFKLLDSYEKESPDSFVVLGLALHFGLRRNEIFNARRDWISFENGEARVGVFAERGFSVKSGEDGYARGSETFGRKLLSASNGFDYLVCRRNARKALDPVVKDLRSIGWDEFKPLHECRKLYGSYVASTQSIYAAQRNLRHRSVMTTNDFYADLLSDEESKSLWAA